jgi:hypothetical protein
VREGPSAPAARAAFVPKYAAHAVPLSEDADYLRGAPASDYWSLAPYYLGQRDDVSCSLAALTTLVNAARRDVRLSADDTPVTQDALFERVNSAVWRRGLAPNGEGVTLDELAELTRAGLASYGVPTDALEVRHVADASRPELEAFRARLRSNEAGTDDWIVLNFLASVYVGTGDYGHFALVGAYDAARARVLVMDPDREYYEPYWVPDEVALAGLATPDSETGNPRGYLYVSLPQSAAAAAEKEGSSAYSVAAVEAR